MRKLAMFCLIIGFIITTAFVVSEKNKWIVLFDGKSTKGWHLYGKPGSATAWKVVNGELQLDASQKSNRGDLITDADFENFDLKLEWKIAKNGNSGIIFYVQEDTVKYKDTYNTGMEMQVLDNDGHPDGKFLKHRAGNLYDLIAATSEPVKPVGEWNAVEIISNKGKLDFYLNGINIVSTSLWDANWKQLIAGSKFKSMPDFGSFKKGKIALQDHGNDVSYRNIMIKKL
jgi:hypothetical protein